MRTIKVNISGVSPYSQSRPIQSPKQDRETSDAYEERTWRERLHVLPDGQVFIPPMAFKNALSECAKFLGKQIPGKGKSTYTKHFEAGVLSMTEVPLFLDEKLRNPLMASDPVAVAGERLFVPSDGVRGSGKRVWKTFPVLRQWHAVASFMILDDIITDDVFRSHISDAGRFIGVGRFRPRNNGYYGRFDVTDMAVKED